MADLFSTDKEFIIVEMPDADISYRSFVELNESDKVILTRLIDETPWRAEEIVVWGKRHLQPRLIAWYGDSSRHYTYSGINLEPLPWTDLLRDIKTTIEATVKCSFNSVLLNYYRNNRDSMGMHSDDEPELGRYPTIASLSLGAVRSMVFKHKTRKELKPVRIDLESGSLLLMKGNTQHNWKHGIDKQTVPCGPRVNLTFRNIFID